MTTPVPSRAQVIAHTSTLRRFLDSRASRLLPQRLRLAIRVLMEYVHDQEATVSFPHLRERPPLDTPVFLLKDDWFLRTHHNARIGSIGIIAGHSALNPDDDGVLVNWGDGSPVRCNLDELSAV
ncbi:hypothetical protein ACFVU2_19145 [Leifsonia sp. NPDC058194]|uniref:hypothetical protein n=1 Tax=Leifsonia sp. NPDC058194 TaxID=3346374 RepID=UPI0036DF13F9